MDTQPRLPARTDILVIGGGLAGCAVAWELAGAGAELVLIERLALNTLASGSNAGSIHAQIPQHEFLHMGEDWASAFAPTIPLLLESIALWRGLSAELGVDLELSLAGGVMVARTEAQLRAVERKAAIERAQGLQVEMLSRNDLHVIAPYVAEDMIGGSFCPVEGRANPLLLAPAFARRAAQRLHRPPAALPQPDENKAEHEASDATEHGHRKRGQRCLKQHYDGVVLEEARDFEREVVQHQNTRARTRNSARPSSASDRLATKVSTM